MLYSDLNQRGVVKNLLKKRTKQSNQFAREGWNDPRDICQIDYEFFDWNLFPLTAWRWQLIADHNEWPKLNRIYNNSGRISFRTCRYIDITVV